MSKASQDIFDESIAMDHVPPNGRPVTITATEKQRAALAELGNLARIDKLVAELMIAPRGKNGLTAKGTIKADIAYKCVLSLEPFDAQIHEEVAVAFGVENKPLPSAVDIDINDNEPPEPIVNGYANLGVMVQEMFLLGLDPYPRAPTAAFQGFTEDPPVTKLADLQQQLAASKNKTQ